MAGGTIAAGLMSAAASFVSGAATITAGQLNMPEAVTLKMKIRNYTRWTMSNGVADNEAGYIMRSPSSLMPASQDFLAVHKANGSAGTYGTLAFDMDLPGGMVRIFVMWSMPNNFNFYSNWMAVGLKKIKDDEKIPHDLFTQMYKGKETFFDRRRYYYGPLKDVSFELDDLVITGRMGSAHKSEGEVTVYPTTEHNFAPAIREEYYKSVLPDTDHVVFQADASLAGSKAEPKNLLAIDGDKPSGLGFAASAEEFPFHEWEIRKTADASYTIRNPFSDKFLTLTDDNKASLAAEEEDNKAQRWQIELVHSKSELFRLNNRKNPSAFLAWDNGRKPARSPVVLTGSPQGNDQMNWKMLPT